MDTQNIIQLFTSAAIKHSQKVAFIQGKKQITYAELLNKVQAIANYFTNKGIGKYDKVLVFIPVQIDLYVTVLSLLYIGACPVFLDEWVSISRLKECLKTVPCKAIIAKRKLLFVSWFISPLRKLIKITPSTSVTYIKINSPVETMANDTALVTFTTGSTGTPKAANRTHAFLQAQYHALNPLLQNNHQVTLTLLPIVFLLNLCLGKTNVLPQKKLSTNNKSSVRHLVQLVSVHSIETIISSPAIIVAIAQAISEKHHPTIVKQIITGGGPVFSDDALQLVNAFPQAVATAVYGSTEAEPISTINLKDLMTTDAETMQLKGLPVGHFHSGIQVAIIPFSTDPIPDQSALEWQSLQLPFGHVGEIVVSGPHVLQAYINNAAAQRQNKFFVNDILWHRTGDEGLIDEENNLYFRGRCTEVVRYQHHIIYPVINAWLLKQKTGLQEAAVLVENDELMVIVNRTDRRLHTQIMVALKDTSLEGATIRYLSEIPKDKRHNTKIDYEKLRQLLR